MGKHFTPLFEDSALVFVLREEIFKSLNPFFPFLEFHSYLIFNLIYSFLIFIKCEWLLNFNELLIFWSIANCLFYYTS